MESKPMVALLGLGTMGQGMARNLLKAGFPLTVWNRTTAKTKPLAHSGAAIAATPAQAAIHAGVVIAMVSDDDVSRSVWLGENGALAAMQPGSIVIESSTLSPGWIAELLSAVNQRGVRMADAPVTGSRVQAETGQLTFLVGSDEETLDAVTPVLRCMGKEVLHLGPVGSGTQMKLINNFLSAVQVSSFAEALAWIERTRLPRGTALDFLKRAAPGSPIFATMADRMTRRTYDVNFLLRLIEKDLRYAHAAAARLGVELSMGSAAEKLFRAARESGWGDKDMSAVLEAVRTDAPSA
jgi:3-hydroxyisobutyrate dehydrogenase